MPAELRIPLEGQHQQDEHVALLDGQRLITGNWCPEHNLGVIIVGRTDQLDIPGVACILTSLRTLEEHLMAKVAHSLARQVWQEHGKPAEPPAGQH